MLTITERFSEINFELILFVHTPIKASRLTMLQVRQARRIQMVPIFISLATEGILKKRINIKYASWMLIFVVVYFINIAVFHASLKFT